MSKDVQLEGVSRDAVVLALKDFYKENPDVSKDTLRNEIVSIVDRLATSRSTEAMAPRSWTRRECRTLLRTLSS